MLATAPDDVTLLFDDEIRPAGGDRASTRRAARCSAAPRTGSPARPRARRPAPARPAARRVQRPLAGGLERRPPRSGRARVRGRRRLAASRVDAVRGRRPVGRLDRSSACSSSRACSSPAAPRSPAARSSWRPAPGDRGGRGRARAVAAGGFGLLAIEPAADADPVRPRDRDRRDRRARRGSGGARRVRDPAAAARVTAVPACSSSPRPTLAGHALDPHRLRSLVALADFVHVAAAAVWIGGLVLLVAAAAAAPATAFRRLPLGALARLSAWRRSRARSPRSRHSPRSCTPRTARRVHRQDRRARRDARARLAEPPPDRPRSASVAELALLAGLIVAVAVLTDLRPPPRAGAAANRSRPRPLPPPPGRARARAARTTTSPSASPSRRGGRTSPPASPRSAPTARASTACASASAGPTQTPAPAGCYARRSRLAPPDVDVALEGTGVKPATLRFTLPPRWPAPAAAALLTRVDHMFRALRTRRHPRAPRVRARGTRSTPSTTCRRRTGMTYEIAGGAQARS